MASTRGGSAPVTADDNAQQSLHLRLRRAAETRKVVERRLHHCRQQLDRVFAVTERISTMRDPDAIQAALLDHYRSMLAAGALFLDAAGCCTRLNLGPDGDQRVAFAPEQVRAVLATHVEVVRRSRRPFVGARATELSNARVLLGAFPRADTETGVVVALRDASQEPFDASDMLAAQAVLAYGAQILSNAAMVRSLQHSALETVYALVNAIDAKDNYTSDHSERVGILARLTGQALTLPKDRLQALEWAGLLHDVGKIGIAEQVLNKPSRLTRREFRQIMNHPRIGHDMLKPVARFEPVLESVLYHHENHDGSGYPEGLSNSQIPLEARIIHVVDIFDALTTSRPYRAGYSLERAMRVLRRNAGRVTDPQVTDCFIAAFQQYVANDPEGFRARFGHLAGRAGDN